MMLLPGSRQCQEALRLQTAEVEVHRWRRLRWGRLEVARGCLGWPPWTANASQEAQEQHQCRQEVRPLQSAVVEILRSRRLRPPLPPQVRQQVSQEEQAHRQNRQEALELQTVAEALGTTHPNVSQGNRQNRQEAQPLQTAVVEVFRTRLPPPPSSPRVHQMVAQG